MGRIPLASMEGYFEKRGVLGTNVSASIPIRCILNTWYPVIDIYMRMDADRDMCPYELANRVNDKWVEAPTWVGP